SRLHLQSERDRGQADFRTEARQRPRARSRQALQGGGMGLRQRTDRRADLGCGRQTSAVRQAAQPGAAGRDAERRRGQSGHCGTGMSDFSTIIRTIAAALLIAAAAPAARAQQAPLQDKPFAEHKIVLQLSDNDPRKQGLVLSVTSNLMKHYDPDKVAIEIVAFGPGIELLRPENPNRKMVESLVAQGARFDICLNTVDTLEREAGKRPEFISAATPVQVGVAQILFLTENGYTLVRP